MDEAIDGGVNVVTGGGVADGATGSSDAEANRLPGRQGSLRAVDDNG